jgi:hypothetical protein
MSAEEYDGGSSGFSQHSVLHTVQDRSHIRRDNRLNTAFQDRGDQGHRKLSTAMTAPLNRPMELKRDASKLVARFHAGWLKVLLKSTPQTLKRACHEIAALEEASVAYHDGAIFSLLRKNLEFVIRDVTSSDWSVARSRNDLRGRTRGRLNSHCRVRIDGKVQHALRDRLSLLETRTHETSQHD